MHEWLDRARVRLADQVDDDASAYELREDEVDRLLELARIAAHESEERTNAPLLSYLVGLAHGRHPDRELAALVDVAIGKR
jgi:Domain of unknown function (DUF6457)